MKAHSEVDDLGIMAWGNHLSTENLIHAYSNGIFPWPMSNLEQIPWVSPAKRGILRFSNLRTPRSLAKFLKKSNYYTSIDTAFEKVIDGCADRDETWILPEMREAYCDLAQKGLAHSVEVWSKDSNTSATLVGGLYGVSIGGTFAGESMFSRESNASKIAILALIEHLKNRGLDWIDIQMVTPHMQALGAEEIDRDAYYDLLRSTQAKGLILF